MKVRPDLSDPAGVESTASNAAREPVPISIVPIHTAVAGRARLKVGGMRGAPAVADLIERGLTGFGGVRQVSASALTGNVTVCYEALTSVDVLVERMAALLRGEVAPPAHKHGAANSLHSNGDEQFWHAAKAADAATRLGTSLSCGLSSEEAGRRLASGGANVITSLAQRSELSILLGQFQSLPVALLAVAAVVSVATGGMFEAGAIMAVIALNGGIGFVTETRAERTIRSLEGVAALEARVLRDAQEIELPAEAVVPGDVMVLQRGMVVPADGRLITARALTVSEAPLTGESVPVEKSVEPLDRTDVALADRVDMIYRGTVVTGGSGTAIVTATGARTEVGRIQRLVELTVPPGTPLQRQLEELGKQLVWITLAASGLIFGTGWLRGLALLQMVRSSLSVAVAAVPEGLPMVATTTLALGVEEMRRHGILIRRLEAVETLAAVDIICFDKTGTLTHGSMTLDTLVVGERSCRRDNGVLSERNDTPVLVSDDARLRQLLCVVSLCSETEIDHGGADALVGSATENALVQAALESGLDVVGLRREFMHLSTQQRTESHRFMATTHRTPNGLFLAVKGSPSEVLDRCAWELQSDAGRTPLGAARRAEIERVNADMAGRGLRVLAVACRELPDLAGDVEEVATEGLTWIGLAGLADPVRPQLPELMAKLHGGGIHTVMLTGDQSATARAVGGQIGLCDDGDLEVIDAGELDRMGAAELGRAARRAHAFARISPGQKLRVVRALQASGAVVAVVGDGINDSPALRAANVGIGFGRDCTAAAREVADVFFASDDIAMLPAAIERGRATYTNVRKAIHYILSTNGSEIMLMLAGSIAGIGDVLSPMQLLWINLISDVLPGIGLALEPPEPDVMQQRPRPADEAILRRDHFQRLGTEAGIITAGASGAGLYGALRYGYASPQTRTLTFGSLVTAQLLHALTCQSPTRSIFAPGEMTRNPALLGIVGGSLAAQSAAMLLPGVRGLLGVAPIGVVDGLAMIAGGVLPFLVNEARKSGAPTDNAALHFRRHTYQSALASRMRGAVITGRLDGAGSDAERLAADAQAAE